MINHVRTLLLNRQREGHGLDEPGEEYIPADYAPRRLSPAMRRAWQSLFGSQPDRLFLNYRVRQLLQIMHGTVLGNDILRPDPRVTYLPFADDLFEVVFGIQVQHIGGSPTEVKVVGTPQVDTSKGICTQSWDVAVQEDEVAIRHRTGAFAGVVPRTTQILLPGSSLTLYLGNASPGLKIRITAVARPESDVSQTLRDMVAAFGDAGLDEVFPPNKMSDRQLLWQRIWNNSHLFVMRMSALLLAIATKIEGSPPQGAD